MTTIRDHAEMLSHLGHLGQRGRRPRILEGTITRVHSNGRVAVSIHGAPPVGLQPSQGIKVASGYTPEPNAHVRLEVVATDIVVRGAYQ